MATRPDVSQTAQPRVGDLLALPLTYEPGGEMLDARGKNVDHDRSEREIDDIAAVVVRALNAHDAMLAALRTIFVAVANISACDPREPLSYADRQALLSAARDGAAARALAEGRS